MESVDATTKAVVEHIDKMADTVSSPATDMMQNVVDELKQSMQSLLNEFSTGLSGSATSELENLAMQLGTATQAMADFPKIWRIYLPHCKLLSKKSNMLFLRFQTPLRMPIQQLCSRCKSRLLMLQELSVMPSQRSKKSCQESLNRHKSKAIKWLVNLLMLQKDGIIPYRYYLYPF